jgi:undecaprenyl-diphosphatase
VTVLYAVLLGVIQGITEFLPVSSSAHLILTRAYFDLDLQKLGLAFDVACHLGTLLAVLMYFRRDLLTMALAIPSMFLRVVTPGVSLVRSIVIGTVPIAALGFFMSFYVENVLRTPSVAATMLAGGGVVLLLSERVGSRKRTEDSLTIPEALVLGVAQAVALIPGVSRSGAVISVALLLGLRRESAARFSFLLGIPAILAATVKTVASAQPSTFGDEFIVVLVVGMVTSAFVGHLVIHFFLNYLVNKTLRPFAFYRIALALTVPIWLTFG